MQQVLRTAAETAATELHSTRRPDQATLSAAQLVQTLVFGWLGHPDASLEQRAQHAARVGVAVSAQAIDQRLNNATAAVLNHVLRARLDHVIASNPVALPIRERFTSVRMHESTPIVVPDALAHMWHDGGGTTRTNTQAALTYGVELDLLTGTRWGLDLAAGRASDHRLDIQHAPTPKGSVRLADLGLYDLGVLNRLTAAGVYWLTKLEPTALIRQVSDQPTPLRHCVERLGDATQWQGEVWVGGKQQVQGRLLVQRVPQEVADARRRRIHKTARTKGGTPSVAALALADWTLLLTNVPAALLNVSEAVVVANVRWQRALLFKLWKSQGQIDTWRSNKPERILCEVSAKVLSTVIQHWRLVVGCWQLQTEGWSKQHRWYVTMRRPWHARVVAVIAASRYLKP